jgi:NAD+ synthase
LLKSEVYSLAKYLEVDNRIITAPPTDGLWPDNRTDEQQIGATYSQLEWALKFNDSGEPDDQLNDQQKEVLSLYRTRHKSNSHKMEFAPTCQVPQEVK